METTQEIPDLTHWERRGIKKGRREGIREGQKKGLRKGKAELMKSQAQHRFGELPAWAIE